MNADNQPEYLPDFPYPGIRPFSYAYRNIFFGREVETRALSRLVVMYRGVLLYSDSGAGKSSLLNAGLVPVMKKEGYGPERIRVQPKTGEEFIVERVSEETEGQSRFLPSIFMTDDEHERTVISVAHFLETLHRRAGDARPLLVFDQFEEWVTLFEETFRADTREGERATQGRILNTIASLINNNTLPVKVLISLREDYLARLTPLFETCPNLPDQYLRLGSLSGDQVYQVIRQPFETYPGRYRPQLHATLAKQIQSQFEERRGGAEIRLTEVQIVARSLFETGKEGSELDGLFAKMGGVRGVLERYLEHTLESLASMQRGPAVGLLTRMVTSAGTRNVISRDDLLRRVELEDATPYEVLSNTLDGLEQGAKLVRRERRREVYYYEIASEFLVEWIRKKSEERQRQAERKRIEAVQHRRRNRLMRVMAGLCLLFVFVSYGYYSLWTENRPWAYLRSISTGAANLLRGEVAYVGRPTEGTLGLAHQILINPQFKSVSRVDAAPRTISRLHFMVNRNFFAVDMRSLNGTTVNSEFLPYGEMKKLADGDIIVLAGVAAFQFEALEYAPLQFWTARVEGYPPARGWGMLVDGRNRTITHLTAERYFLSLDARLRVVPRADQADDAFLIVRRYPNGRVTIEGLDAQMGLEVQVKESDYDYPSYRLRPGGEIDSLSTRWRDRFGREMRGLHDVFGAAYAYKGVRFQIVPIVADSE